MEEGETAAFSFLLWEELLNLVPVCSEVLNGSDVERNILVEMLQRYR